MFVLDKIDFQDVQQWINSKGWVGLKTIVSWFLRLPLSVVVFCMALFLSFVGNEDSYEYAKKKSA